MVYYDGTDYLVGGEVLKDLSGFTLKMADAFVDTPKDNDREVNIHAMDFKHEDAQLVHVPSQNQCCSTLSLLFRPDSGVYMASNVAPENIMSQQASISSYQQPVRDFSSPIPSSLFQQPLGQSSQPTFSCNSAQSLQPFSYNSPQAYQQLSYPVPVYSTIPQRDHPIPTKMKDVNSTEDSDEENPRFPMRNRRHVWTEKEDEELRILVAKYKGKRWKLVSMGRIWIFELFLELSAKLPTKRSETECRQHYCRVLSRKTMVGESEGSEE